MPRRWFDIKAAQTSGDVDVYIYGAIGPAFLGDDAVSAKQFIDELAAYRDRHVHLHINSPGGDAFDGQAIHTAITRHPGGVTSYAEGRVASAASILAQAAGRRVMAENALLMIHKGWTLALGNADELRKTGEYLDKFDETQITVFEQKSNMSRDDVAAALAAETWYTADEALEVGLIDEIEQPLRVAALDLSAYSWIKHPPQAAADPDDTQLLPALQPAPIADNREDGGSPILASEDEGGALSTERSEAFVPGHGYCKF